MAIECMIGVKKKKKKNEDEKKKEGPLTGSQYLTTYRSDPSGV